MQGAVYAVHKLLVAIEVALIELPSEDISVNLVLPAIEKRYMELGRAIKSLKRAIE